MEICIRGYLAASLLLEQEPGQWHALVVLGMGVSPTPFVAAQARTHLYLYFDDVEQPDPDQQAPTAVQVERALKFARGKDRLLVVCRAGQSRSAGLAYLIACQELGVDAALGLIDPERHQPNRRVIALGDALLANPDVLNRFDEWRSRHAQVRVTDFLDRLEQEFDALVAQGATNRIIGV